MTNSKFDPEEVRHTLKLLYKKGDIVELRILNSQWNTVSGYFDNLQGLVNAASEYSGGVPAVYVTLNPIKRDLLARAHNRVKHYAKVTTSDSDIIKRRLLPIDVDPVRPKDISSTDEEHRLALNEAKEIGAFLRNQGWPDPILADSGNGAHLLYRIDLPNDEPSRDLLRRCLEALDLLFSDERLSIDRSVHNTARIWKLYGTMACKGDNIPERPHRLAKLLEVPPQITIVDRKLLQNLAAMLPEIPRQESKSAASHKPLEIERWMADHRISIKRTKPWQGGTVYELSVCPFNPEHNSGEARIIQFSSGALSFGCFHNSCQGNDWDALRDKFEPGRKEKNAGDGFNGKSRYVSLSSKEDTRGESIPIQKCETPWPEPLAGPAFYGLVGEVVRAIEPHSEADPTALLVEFLTAFGSVIGLRSYFRVEADEHRMRLFVTLVGETSKARKGTSWSHIRALFKTIDPDWTDNIQSGLSSGEGLIWAVRDEIIKREPIRESKRVVDYQDVTVDPGVADKRLLVVEPEFASTLRVLGREGNTLSAVIRNAWDTGNLQTLTKNSQAKATGAHISLITHITRGELLRYLTNTEAANGFGNRFLWFCVRGSKSLPFGGNINKVNFEPVIKRLAAAEQYASQVDQIQWAEETRPLWAEVYPEGKPGLFGSMTARAEAYVTRLSCIYALLDQSDRIRPEHLKAALAVWDYAEASVRYIFQTATDDILADEILSMLMAKTGGMTRTEINNYFGGHKSSEQITAALNTLEALDRIRKEEVSTEGRSREIWIFNQSQDAEKAEKAEKGGLIPLFQLFPQV